MRREGRGKVAGVPGDGGGGEGTAGGLTGSRCSGGG